MAPGGALAQLDTLVQSQSVMIATNQMMFLVALAFVVAAAVIWRRSRPGRSIRLKPARTELPHPEEPRASAALLTMRLVAATR